ncbi:hypothetical protein SAR116_0006 [Candidatus Puniceispirillum marinum IMCC1322]|uniref:Type II toxin-antitoxin system HicA family toxin n=2 Tax=Candidatus Puniceispirillum TaxID=767891 RepID=D5BNI3_PUNMI|nr:hypothetical protein SAR116_0006 [Candidatus Puniceispirillum marinum IMCC1322]
MPARELFRMASSKRTLKVREVIAALEKHGFTQEPAKGSHRKFKKAGHPGHVIVSGKSGSDVIQQTLKSMIAQSGLPDACLYGECDC